MYNLSISLSVFNFLCKSHETSSIQSVLVIPPFKVCFVDMFAELFVICYGIWICAELLFVMEFGWLLSDASFLFSLFQKRGEKEESLKSNRRKNRKPNRRKNNNFVSETKIEDYQKLGLTFSFSLLRVI